MRPVTPATPPHLELTDWRRRVAGLYAEVRAEGDPARGHTTWRAGRDELLASHPQSPLRPDDPLRRHGVPYWPYQPGWRFELDLEPSPGPARLGVDTGADGTTDVERIGQVRLPAPHDVNLDVWWLRQYGGGLFLPLRDATAGEGTYGGGRYLLDTAKGADLGGAGAMIVVDMNFAYHPSCRYDPQWVCPLAPAGNTVPVPVPAGERMPDAR